MKALLALLVPLQACSEQKAHNDHEEDDTALAHKFRGLKGGELLVDASFETKGLSFILRSSGIRFPGGEGQYSAGRGLAASYFGDEKNGERFSVPKRLRMLRYPPDAILNERWHYPREDERPLPFLSPPLIDTSVPVAARIPDEVLDRVRQSKGSLTLKLRLTPETLLIGWEVRLGKSYSFKKDKWGNAYATDEDTLPGGDFRERQVVDVLTNGKLQLLEKKGWYIDPKTKQRIETDY
jgi:hypothetical protein